MSKNTPSTQVSREHTAIRTVYFSLLSHFFLAGIKFITGFFGHSYALIADAIESATDFFASFLVFLGFKYAMRPADKNHPYGHGKVEPLITFIIVGLMLFSVWVIVHQSLHNITHPHEAPAPFTLIVLGAIILWKEISFRFVLRKSKETHSTSLRADAWHHRSDAISSVAAFIGISIALIMGEGWESADDWAAIFASIVILYNSYLIFRPALSEIMDEHLYDDFIKDIRHRAQDVDGVLATEKCQVRKVGMRYYIDLHIEVDGDIPVKTGHHIAHAVKDKLMGAFPEVVDVLVHVEPPGDQ